MATLWKVAAPLPSNCQGRVIRRARAPASRGSALRVLLVVGGRVPSPRNCLGERRHRELQVGAQCGMERGDLVALRMELAAHVIKEAAV